MNYLKHNLSIIEKRYPLLYKSLNQISSESEDYQIETSREGSPTIQIDGNYIHSKFNPVREADRFIESEISQEAGFIIFAGLGLAYHVESFLRRHNNMDILLIEPDVSFFLFALSVRDLRPVLESENVQLLIGTEPEDCGIILEKQPGKIVQLVKLRSVYNKNEIFYSKLDTYIQNYISRKEINLSTLKRFGRLWVRNLAANAGQLSRSPGITQIQGMFSGIPALLIAAGPSLDNIKPSLKELQKRFLIVTVDTALRACLEEGIEPDFTVVVDPQYWNSRHLDRCRTDKTILLSETSTYPSVFRQIKGKVFLCSSSFPLGLYMEEKTEIKGKLKAGGSVATAAWDFCRTLSINEIWCAGLDLGFPDKQTHCRGSFFEQRAHWLSARINPSETSSWHALNDAGLTVVESNSGNKTWTDKRMSLYSRWFEEQMSRYTEIQSWNLSDEGIKIAGMPRKLLKDALNLPLIRQSINTKINQIKNVNTDPSLNGHLQNAHIQLLKELDRLQLLAVDGMKLSMALEKSYKKNEIIQGQIDQLSVLDEKILHSVSKDIAGFILQNFITKLLGENKSLEGIDIIKNSFDLYKELKDSASFHIELIKKSQKNTKNT